MLRSILLGLDGPPFTSPVVDLGLNWARRFGAMLVGVGVVNEPALRGVGVGPRGGYLEKLQDEWVGKAQHEVDYLLQQFAIRCSEQSVACKLLEDAGTPWEQILKEAQRYDIIMLGRHTHFESQADSCRTLSNVLHHAARPVIVVPEAPPRPDNGIVLVAYDGSVQAARTLQLFAMTGLHALGDVHVLAVDPASSVAAARTADRAVQFLSSHGVAARPLPIANAASAGKVILDQATSLDASLIVMGACGRSCIEEFFVGSVTKRLVNESSVPLFLYH